MKLLACLLLVGCAAPSYYEVTPYYGTLDLGQRDIDAVDVGVMFTVGWTIGQRAHQERMEDYALAGLAANPRVDREWLQDAVNAAADDAAEEEAASSDIELSDFTDKPETLTDATIYAIWIAALCLLLLTLKQVGLLNRIFPSTSKPKDEDSE